MIQKLRQFVRKTPLFPVIKPIYQRWELGSWERRGKPVPPPHLAKQRAIRDLGIRYGAKVLVETGTYEGEMVEALKNDFEQIYSIELSDSLFEKAKRRFESNDKIEIIHGDSGVELEKITKDLKKVTVFWLDGHYSAGKTAQGESNTPVIEELGHIFKCAQKNHVIIIDDARHFGTDPSYPTLEEVESFVREKDPSLEIYVENDAIRILPCDRAE